MSKLFFQWLSWISNQQRDRRDRMLDGFMTTYAISAYHH
jgi:hypothetical protein